MGLFRTLASLVFLTIAGLFPIQKTSSPLPAEPLTETKVVLEKEASTTLPKISQGKSTATTTPVKLPPPEKTPVTVVQPTLPFTPTPEPKPSEPAPNFEDINVLARKATVNILCTTEGNELSPISGTGAVIRSDGLILTNAHVAQYVLLKNLRQKDYIKCVVRTGSPAYPTYNLELVYISPTWIAENKAILKEQNPKGTGENDFAFLRITGKISGESAPEVLPYMPINTREYIEKGESVLLSSYPAGFLGGLSILQNLHVTTAVTTISDYFTYKANTIDSISLGGTVVSQKGSSGGLVVDKKSSLIGIISTSGSGETTSERKLNAITLGYISRALKQELDLTLEQFLSLNMKEFASLFQQTQSPALIKAISDELSK